MTADELDDFLRTERTCRLATLGSTGAPHVTPLWFVWDGSSAWISSIVRSQRWVDVGRDGRVAMVVDAGTGYADLRGVELRGRASVVGEVPRVGEPVPPLEVVEQLHADKYAAGVVHHDGRHAWLRVTPEKVVSWDFRKRDR